MPKINEKTTTQYERIGCGTFENVDGKTPNISFQVQWVEEVDGIAQFRSVSRAITVPFDPLSPAHVTLFSALRTVGMAALEA